MDKKKFEEETYVDRHGYRVWKSNNKTIHRTRAFHEIYLKDRKKYPLNFSEYQVHHKDKDKQNNRVENLELTPIREHELKHDIHRFEDPVINTLLFYGVLISFWFTYTIFASGYILNPRERIFLYITIVIAILGTIFINRKKKGRRYV